LSEAPAAPAADGFEALAQWPVTGAQPVDLDGFYERLDTIGIEYGPAFQGLSELWRDGDTAYGLVRLPEDVSTDGYGIHPALLDTALHTLFAVPDGNGTGDDIALPFQWTGVDLLTGAGSLLHVRAELDETRTAARIWVADENGDPVARIEGLQVRQATAEQIRAAASVSVDHLYRVDFQPVTAGPQAQDADRLVIDARNWSGSVTEVAARGLAELQQALAGDTVEIVLVTRGAVGEDATDVGQASLWGLVRSARSEHPERVIRLIDTDTQDLTSALRVADEPELTVRAGQILAARLVRTSADADAQTRGLDPAGTVLITGGMGELGQALARHLVQEHGVRRLVLTSRRGTDAPGAAELVGELIAAGAERVEVVACDVADRAQVRTLLTGVDTAHPWTGVFHLAAVLDDGLLTDQNPDRLTRVLAPKTEGALHLHDLARELGLDLAAFVLYSSASGVLGGPGQSNYAAANTALDALAALRRSEGLAATSLSWGLWQQAGIGLTAELGQADVARMRRQGFGALTQQQALATLDAALLQPHAHLVPIKLETASLRRALDDGEQLPPVFRALVPARLRGTRRSPGTDSGLREQFAALPQAERRAAVTEMVRRDVAVVLGITDPQEIGDDQPLKDLGLDSLMAVELRRRLSAQVRAVLPADLAFAHPTPGALADHLLTHVFDAAPGTGNPGTAGAAPLPLERAEQRDVHPATEGQSRLWFLEQMHPGTARYNVALRIRIARPLDRDAFVRALAWMAGRHEALRTGLGSREGRLVQNVHTDVTVPFTYEDLSGLGQDAVDDRIRQEELRPFDLAGPSLLRCRLLDTGADGQILCLTFHHSVTDGWSLTVFLRELYDAYRTFTAGQRPQAAEPAHHVGDYARWEQRSLTEGRFEEGLRFFAAELQGSPILELPPGPQAVAEGAEGGDAVYFTVPAKLRGQLEALASEASVTPYTVFAGAFAVMLARYAGQDDFTLGTVWANRQLPGTSDVLGFFTNTLPLRCDLSGDPVFTDLLAAMQPRILGLVEHQSVPLTEVMKVADTPRTGDDNPLIRAVFNYMGADFPALGSGEDAWLLPAGGNGAGNVRGASKFALGMNLAPSGDGLWGELEYLSHTMDRASAERMVRNFRTLLESLAAQPRRRLSELDLLEAAELAWLEERGGRPSLTAGPDTTTALDLVLAQARRTPDAIALVCDGRETTYRQMVARAGTLAARLTEAGVTAEVPVGVHLPRSADLVVSVLAIWMAGGAYLPVDPHYPQARVDYVIQDSGLRVLVSDRPVDTTAHVLLIGDIPDAPLDAAWPPPAARPALDDLGYVIYTSGSTGTPKGVLIEHGQFVNFCRSVDDRIGGGPGDTWLAVTSPSFDISTVELIWTLTRGYRVVIAQGSVGEWPGYRSFAPTHLQCTPSLARMLLADADGRALLGGLDRMIVGGEALDRPLAKKLLRTVRGSVTNIYGPSECTVWSTTWNVEPGEVSLGDAVLGTGLYVLDSHGARMPRGSRGELWISGRAVTRGYLGRPELTAERYVPDPFHPGARMYRTGDLVRYREDGSLEYCGRIDNQIKLYGHRIELGEIEAVAGEHDCVVECAAVVRQDTDNDPRLFLYWTGRPAEEDLVRAYISERVPAYMVPSRLVRLDELPHTPNKKVDRGALLRMPAPRAAGTAPAPSDTAPAAPAPLGDSVEQLVRRAWAQVLDRPRIETDRGFFELGGNSMTALQAHKVICEGLGREFPLSAVFRYPTVRQLAAFLRGDHDTTRTARGPRPAPPRRTDDDAIAIVGMSCRLPGAPDITTYWNNLRNGTESITRFSETELRAAGVPDTLLRDPNYVRAKGHVENADLFDATFFDYSPAEAETMDPQHRLFLECAWEALEHAGLVPQTYDGSIGVFGGSGFGGYGGEEVNDMSSFFRTMIGTKNDYFATRVAHKLNLRGPALSVQTACSTGLVAAHLARESLLRGESDVALVGASSLTVPLKQGYMYQQGLVLSADGKCRAFDEKGGGTVFGSGVGVVVLRRLSDALAAGDTVYAVIRGSAVNNDGADKVGFTAPSVEGQAQVIAAAHAAAGLTPADIGLIEAHGTATALGDPIEVQALQQVFAADDRDEPCALGSVKTNIGHTDVTAGLAGLIKAALCLHHAELVPSLNFERPNPEMGLDPALFHVNTELRPWQQDTPRRAGVSSFGIGGTNAHVVLEQAPPRHPHETPRTHGAQPAPLPVVLSARNDTALREQAGRWADWLRAHPDTPLRDIAATAATRRAHFTERAVVMAGTTTDAAEALTALAGHRSHRALIQGSAGERGQVVFVFPGQGSEWAGMGRELLEQSQAFADAVRECDEALAPYLDR
ncbi:amino acid adenylation domain-containing protein, partial [Streptomyces sp. OZ13]|uniref:amino acid adenylation domain-containing protein n=1 Tax=Streptomyces sp. OZ13 TaxID=3452210 RepID=UPI003F8A6C22